MPRRKLLLVCACSRRTCAASSAASSAAAASSSAALRARAILRGHARLGRAPTARALGSTEFEVRVRVCAEKSRKGRFALRYSTFPRRPSSRDVAACFPRLTKPLMSCEHQQTSSMAMGQVPRTLAVGCRIRDHIRAGLSVSRLDCRLSAKERPQP